MSQYVGLLHSTCVFSNSMIVGEISLYDSSTPLQIIARVFDRSVNDGKLPIKSYVIDLIDDPATALTIYSVQIYLEDRTKRGNRGFTTLDELVSWISSSEFRS